MDAHRSEGPAALDAYLLAQVSTDTTVATVRLIGELDAQNRRDLLGLVQSVCADGYGRVTLDLSQLTFCDAGGLRALEDADRELRARGARLVLTAPPAHLRYLLALTHLDGILVIE